MLRRWRGLRLRWKVLIGVPSLLLLLAGAAAVNGLRVAWQVDDYAQYWGDRAAEPGDLLYIALGDSAAQGIGASRPERGYVGLLATRIEAASGRAVRVVNLSVTGARTADVLDGQLHALRGMEPDIITLDIGGNDAGRTPPDAFAASFGRLLDALPAGAYVADVPDFGGGRRQAQAHDLTAIIEASLAARPDLVAVALERATARMGWDDYAGDLFHPDDSGYEIWADAFWAAMRPCFDAQTAQGRSRRVTDDGSRQRQTAPRPEGLGSCRTVRNAEGQPV